MILEVRNGCVIVDDDFQYDGAIRISQSDGYAYVWQNGKLVALHRFIMEAKEGQEVDHINRNKLDCRKVNLRFVTRAENQANRKVKGVYYHKRDKKWVARLKTAEKRIHLGGFDTEEEAVSAYQKAHAEYYKEFSPYFLDTLV